MPTSLIASLCGYMIITRDHETEKLALKEKLVTQFEMENLGKLKYFFAI